MPGSPPMTSRTASGTELLDVLRYQGTNSKSNTNPTGILSGAIPSLLKRPRRPRSFSVVGIFFLGVGAVPPAIDC